MMKINSIWNELESDSTSSAGLLLRRYSSHIVPDLYMALRGTEKHRSLALKLHSPEGLNLSDFSNLKDIKVDLIGDKTHSYYFLVITLLNTEHEEVFSVFCEDLVKEVGSLAEENMIVQELLSRLEKWRSLFDKASSSGLNPEEQRGLYGELFLLRKLIDATNNAPLCIKAWTGPEKKNQDFQYENWALEVKTSYGKNHQKVQISSERQLDTSKLGSLFLFHLSLEDQQQNGETLNQIVDDLIVRLLNDAWAIRDFKTKLILVGYYRHQSDLYDDPGYQIRHESFYHIKDAFPRIEESDIRTGVGDVKYSIILSDFASYIIDESTVIEFIQ